MMEIKWESILGHEQNIVRLKTLLQEQKMPHALLFFGPEGVGKLKAARVLAAALLCAEKDAPCGRCASCQALLMDTHPDFYEILPESKGKAAKSIKIEQVRAMQIEIARIPILSSRRVVVIDGAETMNDAAANSLLKTLEEPMGQVVFILVTGARTSLLDTILSRCMPVPFGMLPRAILAAALQSRGIPSQQALELAALSDGSMGRALHLYENGGMELRDDAAAFLLELSELTMEKVWQKAKELGGLPHEKLSEWLMYLNMLLRDLLVLYSGAAAGTLYHEDLRERLSGLLPTFPERRVFALLELVRSIQQRMGANVNLRLLMEGFLIRIRDI